LVLEGYTFYWDTVYIAQFKKATMIVLHWDRSHEDYTRRYRRRRFQCSGGFDVLFWHDCDSPRSV